MSLLSSPYVKIISIFDLLNESASLLCSSISISPSSNISPRINIFFPLVSILEIRLIAKLTEFGFAFGYWNYRDGSIIVSETDTEILNKKHPYGSIITKMPLKLATGKETKDVWPAHVTQVEHLKEFIKFLRHCGGFEVW